MLLKPTHFEPPDFLAVFLHLTVVMPYLFTNIPLPPPDSTVLKKPEGRCASI